MENEFSERVLKAFKNIIREIEKGSSEHDVRYRFVKYFVEEVLGYEPKYIKWEKKRADLTIVDENDFSVIKIETKKPAENIDKSQHEEQAFKYEEETTKFIGLTNFLQFKLWEIKKTGRELRINLDFSNILGRKPEQLLSGDEKSQVLFLNNLTKESLFSPAKYGQFDENYARIDITKEAGFRKLLDRLNFIVNGLLLGYTLKSFGEYKEGYAAYEGEIEKIEKELKNKNNHRDLNHGIVKYKQKLEEKYEKYKSFSGFSLWKHYSGKDELPDEDVKEVFCKETIYVLLNKLLFLRICEDKGLLEKSISNGGIEQLRQLFTRRFSQDVVNKEIIETAFKSGKTIYSRFYETGILDWFRTGDGELNGLLNNVLWILNQFDFTHVDRDILGNLYEKYLPGAERKKLGEFYTPTEVIDYILTSVDYTYSYDIETKDLLDPACGSGGFLVRATRRLISRYLMKFGKTDKTELRNPKKWKEIVGRLSPDEAKIILDAVRERIHGLDINQFACHIAEMNMLFQLIDIYQMVREKYKDYGLGKFKIYRTDSLEKPAQKQITDFTHAAFLEEQEEIDAIKNKKFDFVVGNPPYVRQEKITSQQKKLHSSTYKEVFDGRADLYVYFIKRGIDWLTENGKFGYIVSGKFIKTKYGKYLRAYIPAKIAIKAIIDLRGAKVFNEATNDPIILVLYGKENLENNNFNMVIVKKEKIAETKELTLKNTIRAVFEHFGSVFQDDFILSYTVPQNRLISKIKDKNGRIYVETWNLTSSDVEKVRNKIMAFSKTKLCDVCDTYRGIRTGANDIFTLSESKIKHYRIENKILKPVIEGKDVNKYFIKNRNLYLPYITKGIELREFSNIFSYFLQYKPILEGRAQYKQRKGRGEDICWYEIEQPLSPSIFENLKIIVQRISNQYGFAFDENKHYILETCSTIVPKIQDRKHVLFILGLLNSSLTEFFAKTDGKTLGKTGYEFEKQFLDRLPVKLPETSEEKRIAEQIIKRVEEILELHKSGMADVGVVLEGEETEKLCNLPKVAFSMRDGAKFEKIWVKDSKIYLNAEDYVEIKDSKTLNFVRAYIASNAEKFAKSKDVKTLILNLPIPRSGEVLDKMGQSQDKEKIGRLEQEIDELVYGLYGITKEEKKIVEESLGRQR